MPKKQVSETIIQAGAQYIFVKSGSLVTALNKCEDKHHKGLWVVARVDTGKEMLASGKTLVDPKSFAE